MHVSESLRSRIVEKLQGEAGMDYFGIAQSLAIPEQLVIECLHPDEVTKVGAGHFKEIMVMVANWGDVRVTVQTGSVLLTVEGLFPLGKFEENQFVLFGGSPYIMSGKIQHDQLSAVYFVRRVTEKLPSKAVMFFDHRGNKMLEISLMLNDRNVLNEYQVEYYLALLERLSGKPSCSCCS